MSGPAPFIPDYQPASGPASVWQGEPARISYAEAPKPPEYQFDLGNALIVCAVCAVAGFIWFARRRLMWLARHAYSELRRFIRWLRMPPDGKI